MTIFNAIFVDTAANAAHHNSHEVVSTIMFAVALVVSIGALAQWIAWRFKIPAIVLLSAGGLIIGPLMSYVPWIELPQFSLANTPELHPIISLAVAVILFEGGLNLRIRELREAGPVVKRLTSVGVILAWAFGALACYFIGGISLEISLLIGALLVVTGPTVIIPLLRQAGLNKRTASYLKWEGIINDPIGVLLAVLVFEYLTFRQGGTVGLGVVAVKLGKSLLIAAVLGAGGGYLLGRFFRTGSIPEYLKAPIIFSAVIVFFAISNFVQEEAGLLTVTIMGMVMGNMRLRSIDEMRRFKEYLTILLVSAVFVILTASLEPSSLEQFDFRLVLLLLAFMFLVRPAAIWLSTIGLDVKWQDRFLMGWIAPRGVVAAAAAGIFALPLVEDYPDAAKLVPFTFALIFATVIAHGFSVAWLGRKLNLNVSSKKGVLIVGASPWTTALSKLLKEMDINVILSDTSWHRLRDARLAGLNIYYGEILSERAEESLELVSVGTLLAATSNDAYNALVCTSFGPEMNRRHIYQLPMTGEDDQEHDRSVSHVRRGIPALGEDNTFENLWLYHARGWAFQKTRLTEEYNWRALRKDLPEKAIIVAKISEAGEMEFVTPEHFLEPAAGDRIISYVPEIYTRRPSDKKAEKKAEQKQESKTATHKPETTPAITPEAQAELAVTPQMGNTTANKDDPTD